MKTRGRLFLGDSNVQPHQNIILFNKSFLCFTSLQLQAWHCTYSHHSWYQNTSELKVHTAPVQRGNLTVSRPAKSIKTATGKKIKKMLKDMDGLSMSPHRGSCKSKLESRAS